MQSLSRRAALARLSALVAAPMVGALLPSTARAAGRITVTDDVGRAVDLPLPVGRAVIFNRFNTEFVRAVAGSAAIVGVDAPLAQEPVYWPTITAAMVAGQSQSEPNFEAIVALTPDVVIFPRNGAWEQAVKTLTPFGIAVLVVTGWDPIKHEANVDLIGRIFGRPEKAAALNAFYVGIRDDLSRRLAGVPRKPVYMEQVAAFRTPIPGSGWHDMIEMAGGRNIFGDIAIAGQPTARGTVHAFEVDPEAVIARQPELIFKIQPSQYAPFPKGASRQTLLELAARPGFADLPAVRSGATFHISEYLANACSKVIGAQQIAKWLHPDRMADIDPSRSMARWLADFQGVPFPGGYTYALTDARR